MKRLAITLCVICYAVLTNAQVTPYKQPTLAPEIWTESDLMQPAELASVINDPHAAKPLIYNIGVTENIEGAIKLGAASEKGNLKLLRNALSKVPVSATVVVYCGCCPFAKCPNIRPAFTMLKDMGFINAKLLNLSTNLKTDWINKGYPLAKK